MFQRSQQSICRIQGGETGDPCLNGSPPNQKTIVGMLSLLGNIDHQIDLMF